MNDRTNDFERIFTFVIELEKLKTVRRKIKTIEEDRYENSAEHSWHAALTVFMLAPYASVPLRAERAVKMLLLHDVVEIDAGDKFVYGDAHDDYENERAAAKRIFGLLPPSLGAECLALWEEFEKGETPEAVLARAVDRMMPVLQNLHNNGQSWVAHGVSLAQVVDKNRIIEDACPELWQLIYKKLLAAHAAGELR